MRIEKLRFCNLNSLKGEWVIDFTDPGLNDSGLFLITGPTGAGKTTLLDALCLALYGRTPRLDKISDTTNEAMTRRTGFCFAEVIFSTDKGTFRSLWFQHRAKQKPDGALQQPRMEFENCDDRDSLTVGVTRVKPLVVEATGMTFDQFSRSMLLAQGQFARFLHASAAERSPILEDITGTEIYSLISRRTQELAKVETNALKSLEDQLQGILLLSDEERESLNRELAAHREELASLQTRREKASAHLLWLTTRKHLQDEVAQALSELNAALASDAAQAESRVLLDRDAQARTLDKNVAGLAESRANCQTLIIRQAELQKALPDLQNRATSLQAQVAQQEQVLASAERTLTDCEPAWRQMRTDDAAIAAAAAEWTRARKAAQSVQTEKETALKNQEQVADKRTACASTLAALHRQLAATGRDAGLATDLKALEQRLAARRDLLAALARTAGQRQKVVRQQAGLDKKAKKAAQDKARAEEALQALASARSAAAATLADLLGTSTPEALRRAQEGLRDTAEALRDRLGRVQDWLALAQEEAGCTGTIADLEARLAALNRDVLPGALKEQSLSQAQVRDREALWALALQVQNLEAQRALLVAGRPCPCCGSTEHPWAEGCDPALSGPSLQADLNAAREQLAQADARVQQLRTDAGRLEASLATLVDQRTRVQHRAQDVLGTAREAASPLALRTSALSALALQLPAALARTVQGLAGRCQALPVSEATPQAWAQELEEGRCLQQDLQAVSDELADTLRSVQAGEARVNTLIQDEARAERERLRKQADVEHVQLELKQCADQAGSLQAEQERLAGQGATQVRELAAALAPYGLSYAAEDADADDIVRTLHERLDQRKTLEEKADKLKADLTELDKKVEAGTARLAQMERQLQEAQHLVAGRAAELAGARSKRAQQFGSRNPDTEEKSAREVLHKARTDLDTVRKKAADAEKLCTGCQERLAGLAAELERAERRSRDLHTELLQHLQALGFASEEELGQARLSDAERTEREQADEAVRARLTRARSLHAEKDARLAAHLQTPQAEQDVEELARECQELQEQQNALRQQMGAHEERLRRDEADRLRSAEARQACERQKLVADQWKELDLLIGSSDGKKFRNFAQSITFARLVACANEELASLTDRYILTQDPGDLLEFNVIDTYQGNEQRSIRNLSGGETFLVSLALALGLSSLSGGRVHIETMFLDEGFGTLDPEALDSAISTLAGLKGRGTGLIGIISHVEALQERVETQIQLLRGADGVSTLSGPGCSRK
ncbi:MAG TPA: AAA family ATPase [Candidatus Desulfovibrio intestinipullorum]|uniref:AAA family ATPase n=1 Tax=Candidatus Desulfovibrio intestinipullorum TaxID=2838536 RepID=A0A9D1TQD3_9BACT|nr:AAA family ATPase [Candidatus Desulfovibrio intestinipullorum]